MSPEYSPKGERRRQILEQALSVLRNMAENEESEASKLLKSSADYDGPMQSKQPDEMVRLEFRVHIHDYLHATYSKNIMEIRDILDSVQSGNQRIEQGSVFVWDLNDSEDGVEGETVIITESGGGEFPGFRLLAADAPLTKAITGKKEGETVKFGEISVKIREII